MIYKTGKFNLECDKWTEKDTQDNTWANFEFHVALAHKRMRESKGTANNEAFASANAILEETVTHL